MNEIVAGRRGEGKSTFAVWRAYQMYRLIIAWDPRGLFAGRQVHTGEELEEEIDRAAQALKNNSELEYMIAFVPMSGNVDEEFHAFAEAILPPGYENARRYFSVIIDEAGARALQNAAWINSDLDRLLKRLPMQSTLMIQTAHSLKNFESGSRDLMDGLYCFQLQGRSLEAVMEYTDGPPEMRQAIESLPPHHLVYYNFARHDGAEFEVLDDPAMWYSPLRASSSSETEESDGGETVRPAMTESDEDGEPAPPRPRKESPFDRWVN